MVESGIGLSRQVASLGGSISPFAPLAALASISTLHGSRVRARVMVGIELGRSLGLGLGVPVVQQLQIQVVLNLLMLMCRSILGSRSRWEIQMGILQAFCTDWGRQGQG